MKKLFTREEAADFLGLSRTGMYNILRDGRLKEAGINCFKLGEDWRIDRVKLEQKLGKHGACSPQEAAERLGLNRRTLINWAKAGKVRGLQIGNSRTNRIWLISIDAVRNLETTGKDNGGNDEK